MDLPRRVSNDSVLIHASLVFVDEAVNPPGEPMKIPVPDCGIAFTLQSHGVVKEDGCVWLQPISEDAVQAKFEDNVVPQCSPPPNVQQGAQRPVRSSFLQFFSFSRQGTPGTDLIKHAQKAKGKAEKKIRGNPRNDVKMQIPQKMQSPQKRDIDEDGDASTACGSFSYSQTSTPSTSFSGTPATSFCGADSMRNSPPTSFCGLDTIVRPGEQVVRLSL
jgi:hypothetical protein